MLVASARRTMGQAFRRASGRIRAASSADATPSSSAAKSAVDRRPPVGPTGGEEISKTGELGAALDSGTNFSSLSLSLSYLESISKTFSSSDQIELEDKRVALRTLFDW